MNQNIKRVERPDNADFKTFVGGFFLIAAIPITVWAYWCFKGTAYYSDTNRGNIEGAICAFVSLSFFANAVRLFTGALKTRKIKPQYKPIDWRTIPLPTRLVEVRQKKIYDVLLAVIAVFFIGMSLLISFQTLTSQFEATTGKVIKGILFPGVLMLVLMAICYLTIRAKRRAVRQFDASGITRNDGRQFAWNEFQGVATRIDINYARQKYVWRIELALAGGEKAWIIPNRIKNAEEVFKYLIALPRAFEEQLIREQ